MKQLCFKVLLGSLLISSIALSGATEFKTQQYNNSQVKIKEIERKQDIYFNYSLMNIIPAMKDFGYKAEFVDIDSEVTRDNGNPVVENKIVKTEKKKGVKFTKDGIHMATFPINKSVPSDHNLYEWSGCTEKTSADENNLKIEFYITLCGLRNGEKKGVDNEILMEEKPLFVTDDNDLPKAIDIMSSLLKYPEGKMLIYSIFLNQSSYMYYQASKKTRSKYIDELNKVLKKCCENKLSWDEITDLLLEKFDDLHCCEYEDIPLSLTFDNSQENYYSKDSNTINICAEKVKKDKGNYYEEGNYCVQTSDTPDLTITYFHELCHYLTLSGQNWFRYCFEHHKDMKVNTSELNKNGKLIVKYWDEIYGRRKEYKLNLIHLLLNDLFRYNSEDTRIGSLSEILATSWNNLGKDYYGNHLCENLLLYRIYGKIRDSHTKLYYYEKLGKSRLSNFVFNESGYDYEKLLEKRYHLQWQRFLGRDTGVNTDSIVANIDDAVLPFEICKGILKINAPGYSYSYLNPKESGSLKDITRIKEYKKELLSAGNYDYVDTLYLVDVHYIVDSIYTVGNKVYTREETIKLVENVLTNSHEIHKKYITQINIVERSEKSENDINKLLVGLRDEFESIKGRIKTLMGEEYELNSKVKSLQKARDELFNKIKNKHREKISSSVSDDFEYKEIDAGVSQNYGIENNSEIDNYYSKNGTIKILDKKILKNNSKLNENNKLFKEASNESKEAEATIKKAQQYIWDIRRKKNVALKELEEIIDNMMKHLYVYINQINGQD